MSTFLICTLVNCQKRRVQSKGFFMFDHFNTSHEMKFLHGFVMFQLERTHCNQSWRPCVRVLALRVKRPTTAYRQLGLLNFFMLMSQRKWSRKGQGIVLWLLCGRMKGLLMSSIKLYHPYFLQTLQVAHINIQQMLILSSQGWTSTVIHQLHLEQEVVCSSTFRVSLDAQSMCISSHRPQTSHLANSKQTQTYMWSIIHHWSYVATNQYQAAIISTSWTHHQLSIRGY